MATTNLTNDDFKKTIEDNEIVLVDFWADWCGPCKRFAPVYEKASTENTDIVFGKVDTEAQQELAMNFQITAIPTLMAFRQGIMLFNQAGAMNGSTLKSLISQIKELDMEEVKAQAKQA
ncbi:thioredoxin [Raineyella antarctica]|uniref:Thioredoxin n=1 Tax=Raineyella antarctica TaxID=1577474 RepID=A0A1G6GF16_9ACTN|nr:thioredoxin [Raineyella antarctica]SDB80335.1 thioredoxin [Raineyella antarctica]